MGNESSLPHRVNLVLGGRYVLTKVGHGNSPVEIVDADEVLSSPKRRRDGNNKWLLKVDDEDDEGRPVLCIIRNDHHPQRSLRADRHIWVDNNPWGPHHKWVLEYVEVAGTPDAVISPFRLRNKGCDQYLAVDEASKELIMQPDPPKMLWEFQDAGDRGCISPRRRPSSRAAVPPSPCRNWAASAGTSRRLLLEFFDGSLADAYGSHPGTSDGSRAYTPPDAFLATGFDLGDEVELAAAPMDLTTVLQVLLGPGSDFRERLADGIDPVVLPVQPAAGRPWLGLGLTRQVLTIPVKGRRPLEEESRVVLCRDRIGGKLDGRGPTLLAWHKNSVLRVGWPVGDIVTETLHLFMQDSPHGPVRLRCLGKAHMTSSHQQALDGMRAARRKFVAHALACVGAAQKAALPGVPARPLPVPAAREGQAEQANNSFSQHCSAIAQGGVVCRRRDIDMDSPSHLSEANSCAPDCPKDGRTCVVLVLSAAQECVRYIAFGLSGVRGCMRRKILPARGAD